MKLYCNQCDHQVSGPNRKAGLVKQLLGSHKRQRHKGRKGGHGRG